MGKDHFRRSAEMEANALVSKVWNDFRTHERALSRLGFYRDDIAVVTLEEDPYHELNRLKHKVLKRWRKYNEEGLDSSTQAVPKADIKRAVEWVSTLMVDDAYELASDYEDEDEEPTPTDKKKYVTYAGLVFLGVVLEYLFTHWVRP